MLAVGEKYLGRHPHEGEVGRKPHGSPNAGRIVGTVLRGTAAGGGFLRTKSTKRGTIRESGKAAIGAFIIRIK